MATTSDAVDHGWPDRHAIASHGRASVTVIEAVSEAANTPVEQLPILYDVIDPDALDALFSARPADATPFDGEVTFTYAGFRVTVGKRTVTIRPIAE